MVGKVLLVVAAAAVLLALIVLVQLRPTLTTSSAGQHTSPGDSRTSAPATTESGLTQLAADFAAWVPAPPHPVDAENPYRRRVVAAGEQIVPLLLAAGTKGGQPLDPEVISVLGEIGSAQAFPALLKEYRERPVRWTAISLGACMGPSEVRMLFAALERDPASLRSLLAIIYGAKWREVSTLNAEQLRQDLQRSLERLRTDCRLRSRPLLG